MHPAIQIVTDYRRGCGWRALHGLYLRSDGPTFPCGRLPIPVATCPCCGYGIRPARGWTWVDGDKFLAEAGDCQASDAHCRTCPLERLLFEGIGRAGLLWIGEKFYPNTVEFLYEAEQFGISRRITQVPKGFVVGETFVLLAHRKAIVGPYEIGKEPEFTPGIFRIFRPERIEVVVDGTEPDEVIEGYLKRGLTPVRVLHAGEYVQPEIMQEVAA